MTELVRYLLKQPGVQYVLSAKLSQDCLESYFGKQRMRGGYCDNPRVASFMYGAQSLRVQGSTAVNLKEEIVSMADQMRIQSMWMKHLFQNVEDYKKVRLYLLTVMVVIIIIIM